MQVTRILLVIPALVFWACQSGIEERTQQQLKEQLQTNERLEEVYTSLDHQTIWIKAGGLNKRGKEFMEQLDQVVYDGLDKEDYNYEALKDLVAAVQKKEDDEKLVELEISMSEAFLQLANDLHLGKVDPAKLLFQWKIERKKPEQPLEEVLQKVGQGKTGGMEKVLAGLRPKNQQYDQLRDVLKEYISIEDTQEGNIQINVEDGIEPGEQHKVIPAVRKALVAKGDLENYQADDSLHYDDKMVDAVKAFQIRHGLQADGILGDDFKEAIHYNRSDLIAKLQVNLERLRWLPDFTNSDKAKVIVNIPNFYMDYIEGNDTVFTSKVIVGKYYRQTPVFASEMSYLVFSPTWTLPETILWNDVIPEVQKDREYLKANNMKVINYDGSEVKENSIKWNKLDDKDDFPYKIRQAPGDDNALGRVKFMFPNAYDIYIHDSPAKSLYEKDERTFSSGCIRMEKSAEFAALLLEDEAGWEMDDIQEAMSLSEEKLVNLQHHPEVWILYLTVWCGKGGMQIREDVYGSDVKLAQLMDIKISKTYY